MDLTKMKDRINTRDAHDTLFFLTRCLTLPRLTYFLRVSSFNSDTLREHDKTDDLEPHLDEFQWKQTTLLLDWVVLVSALPPRLPFQFLVFHYSLQQTGIYNAAEISAEL